MNQEHGNSQGGSVLWNEAPSGLATTYSSQGWGNFEHRVSLYQQWKRHHFNQGNVADRLFLEGWISVEPLTAISG